ncbi:hypothetical protein sscle_01g006780 [Sclerotinia sclerotiorum 1980 UF-70]|uniref:Uncharacterized protein n=1 Tax=Sclerotinia sclerotiorum (strain ATCC 18683 / 1980 / Ss-1) TaxID=665079 RepID=A0A1D9PT61_SCLS1|nr:hypothetical protein sscle_01g006780 [Sclerotinia sclerotiorum 1980 UF-70]
MKLETAQILYGYADARVGLCVISFYLWPQDRGSRHTSIGYGVSNALGFECVAGGEPCNFKWAPTSAEIASVLSSTLKVVTFNSGLHSPPLYNVRAIDDEGSSGIKAILNRAGRDETYPVSLFTSTISPMVLALILALFKAKGKGLNHS